MKRSWDIRRALALLGLAALPLQAAMAADTPADATGTPILAEVVVTATHREENEKTCLSRFRSWTIHLLDSLGNSGDDIKQLAFKVPSLNIESSNGRAFPRFISAATATPTSTISPPSRSGCTTTISCRRTRP